MKHFENVDLHLKVRRLSFLEDLIKHYNDSNRGEVNGRCRYQPIDETSEGCAIGRHLLWDKYKGLEVFDKAIDFPFSGYEMAKSCKLFQSVMPHWMESLGSDFLSECQDLHDDKDHWDSEGLSRFGLETTERIKLFFNL